MKNQKQILISLLFFAMAVSLGMPAGASPLRMDAYVISDEAAVISQLNNFFVASSGTTGEVLAIRDEITRILSDYGYHATAFSPKSPNLIVIMYNVTNEVRKIDIYTDESELATAAEMYKMFADTARTMYPDTRDMSTSSMVRRSKGSFPVQLVTIYAYILQNEYSIRKAWEGGAGSAEGTSADLPLLTAKALTAFPRPAPSSEAQAN